MADRLKVFEQIRRKEITKTQGSQILGISRQRITQLMNKKPKGAPPMGNTPTVVKPSPVDPLREVFAAPPAEAPTAAPGNLADVMKPFAEPSPAAAPTPGAIPVNAVPHDEGPAPINAEDAQAGRELLKWLTKFCREEMVRILLKTTPNDPRIAELKDENKFLEIAMKRNSEKAAPLGKLTNGLKGLIIGYGLEILRVVVTVAHWKPSPGAAAPPPPPRPAPATVPAPSAAPSGPPPEAKPVEAVRDDIEGPVRRRGTMEERIAAMNEKK